MNDVAVDAQGMIYASLRDTGNVKVFNALGKYVGTLSNAGQKGQDIDGVKALTILPSGDLACLRGGGKWIFIIQWFWPPLHTKSYVV